jgi:hypothetical protein
MSKEILVVAEHLKGKLADITFEMLGKGRELAERTEARLVSLVIGSDVKPLADQQGIADVVLHSVAPSALGAVEGVSCPTPLRTWLLHSASSRLCGLSSVSEGPGNGTDDP